MCDFISWKENPSTGRVFFLKDNDVFSPHGRETLRESKDNDVLGHSAIDAYCGPASHGLRQHENRHFWDKTSLPQFPPEIAVHLESPETLLNAWGKTLRYYLQPDDAFYILKFAPEPWRSALESICMKHVAKSAEYSFNALLEFKNLTPDQKKTLIAVIVQDGSYSDNTLLNVQNLTRGQVSILIRSAARNARRAQKVLFGFKGLTVSQKDTLVRGIARNAYYAFDTLRNGKDLSREYRDILVRGAARIPQEAYQTLLHIKDLTRAQKEIVLKGVKKDTNYSSYAVEFLNLTRAQKKFLRG